MSLLSISRSAYCRNTIRLLLLMRPYINACITKKIILYGSVVIGLGICMVLLISISRFTSIEAEGSNIENIWIWLGLYAGEGVLNFNSLMWYV